MTRNIFVRRNSWPAAYAVLPPAGRHSPSNSRCWDNLSATPPPSSRRRHQPVPHRWRHLPRSQCCSVPPCLRCREFFQNSSAWNSGHSSPGRSTLIPWYFLQLPGSRRSWYGCQWQSPGSRRKTVQCWFPPLFPHCLPTIPVPGGYAHLFCFEISSGSETKW